MRATMNRRAFLRTAASASAVTAAAGAVTIAVAAEHPDAALLALGARFDRSFPRLRPAQEALKAIGDEFDASWPGAVHGPGYIEAWRKHRAGTAERRLNRLFELVDGLTTRIRETPATTFAGISVKARALKHDLCMWCDDPSPREDWDFDDECLAGFIDEVARLAQAGRVCPWPSP